jgi:microcystin-dependent protein
MSSPFVAEIRMFGFNFPPKGWAFCDGQLMPISQNTALFSLLGTQYGGDGKSNFALPNLQASVPMHTDQYSGGGNYPIGAQGGEQTHTLIPSELPAHSHFVNADTGNAGTNSAAGNIYKSGQLAGTPPSVVASYTTAAPNTGLHPLTVGFTGGGVPHNNMMPYLTLNFCIALQGIYPARQ